jgi:RNA polymerase sporulation-specific sigma factor
MTEWLHQWSQRSLACLPDEEVVSLARGGDVSAAEHLLTRYRKLVEGKARGFFLTGADHDDVIQEGMIGLYKAIRDFRADRLAPFRCFAEICVTRQIVSAVKSARRRKHLPLNQYVPLFRPVAEGEPPLAESLAAPRLDDGSESSDLDSRLREYLARDAARELTRLELTVIRSRMEGKSYQQVAGELGCTPKRIDNALQRAKRKIWHRLGTGAT